VGNVKLIKLIDSGIDSGIPILGGFLLVIMVGLTFLQIVLRNFFNSGITWSDDLTQFCMTWLALVGSIWLTKNNLHLNTGLKIHKKLNKLQVCLIESILGLVIISSAAVVAYQSTIFSIASMDIECTSARWLKLGYAFIALPIFMLHMCCHYLRDFFRNLACIFKKD
jgi:TRAP-type C4-dicarboxylate transport system permease small subunit